MSSHALLLRLFLSPAFFSLHIALKYLLLYADNIGITYYLAYRLRDLDVHELNDVWGFICHLLVARPTRSRALEVFVVDAAQRSTHVAMMTLWFMQASLHDFASSRDTLSFAVCQRVLHKCHEIIFNDLPRPSSSPYLSATLSAHSPFSRRKLRHHPHPALVGMGVVLAATPAMPALSEFTGQIAIEQGRVDDDARELGSLQMSQTDLAPDLIPKTAGDNTDLDEPDSPQLEHSGEDSPSDNASLNVRLDHKSPVPVAAAAAQTMPALPLHLRSIQRSRASQDPLGQLDAQIPSHQSSLSLPGPRASRPTTPNTPDILLEKYDFPAQAQLLRGHYCHSQIQFILDLENICKRLLIVPKPARISALRAELTALNHKLPAEVCMPMWCSSSDSPCGPGNMPQPHHRIVRIPPGESVVLNSAERAPYLLLIEILNEDLDFDPAKRANKEILKRIVVKEDERRGTSKDLVLFGRGKSRQPPQPPLHQSPEHDNNITPLHSVLLEPSSFPTSSVTSGSTFSLSESDDPEEEVDLVEQLYGSQKPLQFANLDIAESIVLPPAPKNKDLDIAAWSASSPSPTGSADKHSRHRYTDVVGQSRSHSTSQSRKPSLPSVPLSPRQNQPNGGGHGALSLDDYSQRMRTAAIMLAQLNANLVRESATPLPLPLSATTPSSQTLNVPSPTSRGLWIPGTGWFTGSSDSASPDHQQQTPLLAASQKRMRLQYAEAQQIRDRIMKEMLALEEERMERMKENRYVSSATGAGLGIRGIDVGAGENSVEDEGIIRRELNKVDPSAVVFSESWAAKKSRIKGGSPYGHLANWDCVSVIVKTGGDLRQEQLAVQLIREFQRIWAEENCSCWVRYFKILILGATSGLVETITDAVSVHSIKKAEYAKRLAQGKLGHVTLMDHFQSIYGDASSVKFARAQRNFAKSLAGYSIVTFLLQVKDRHNGNILLDRDGHLIHIDFGFILSNTPGNIGFEAAPFKLPPEYIEVLGGTTGAPFLEFRRLFREGFETARKHCDRIITLVELMQKDSTLPCFVMYGEQTAQHLRDRFQPTLTHSLIGEYVDRLIDTSLGSNWTRLYDSYQYYSQSIL